MDVFLPYSWSIFLVLLASFMWNTWFITLKYVDQDYPTDAYVLTLYLFSFFFVWLVAFVVRGRQLPQELHRFWLEAPDLFWRVIGVGATYAIGMRLLLTMMRSTGLVLMTSVFSSIAILLGTVIAIQTSGLPGSTSPIVILAGAGVLAVAVVSGVQAGRVRDQVKGSAVDHRPASRQVGRVTPGMLAVSAFGALCVVAYPYGLAAGIRAPGNPRGLDPVTYMAVLAAGSLAGVGIVSGLALTIRQQWSTWWRAPRRYHALACLCGFAHYGGNIIHALAVPSLNASIAWPMGQAGGLWAYLWGLVYGEFKGAPRAAWLWLGAALTGFVSGILILGRALYA